MCTLQDENYNIHGIKLSVLAGNVQICRIIYQRVLVCEYQFYNYYFRDFNKFDEKRNLNKANLPFREMQIPTNVLLLQGGRNEVLSDRKMTAHLRVFIYKTVIQPGLAYRNAGP